MKSRSGGSRMTDPAARPRRLAGSGGAIKPWTEAFIDGRFVPAASGKTFTDLAGAILAD
jgi:hypothetical protein